jgi:tetratricopeptide (TPR) repeat protein
MAPSVIKHLSTFIFTFIAAVILFEGSLKLFNPQGFQPSAVLLEQKYGVNLTPSNIDSRSSNIKSNRNHIRSIKETPYTKKENTFRILALGDSVTLGMGVKNDETWTSHLERLLNDLNLGIRFEVLNAGAYGQYKPTRHYLYLKNEGYKFSPDLVIIGRGEWEMNSGMGSQIQIANIREEKITDQKLKIFLEGMSISPHGTYYLSWLMGQINKLPFYEFILGSSRFYFRIKTHMNAYLSSKKTLDSDFKNKFYYYLNSINWEDYKEISLVLGSQEFKLFDAKNHSTLPYLSPSNISYRKSKVENATHFGMGYAVINEIVKLVSQWQGKTLLIEIPVFADVMSFTEDTNYLPQFKNQDPVFSYPLSKGFIRFQKNHSTPTYLYDDNHWAPGGHYLAALLTYNYLVANRLIPIPENKVSPIPIESYRAVKAIKNANANYKKVKGYRDLLDANVNKNSGNPEKAISGYLKFLKYNNDQIEIHLQLGIAYYSVRNFDEAFKHMKIAAKGKSKTRTNKAYRNLYAIYKLNLEIETYVKNKKFKEAIHTFESYSFPIREKKHKFYYWIGLSHLGLKNHQEAENYFYEATQLKPDSPNYHINLANVYFMRKSFQKAISSYEKSLSLKDDQPKAYWYTALSYLNLGNKDLAISTFKKGLEFDPNNVTALNYLRKLGSS